MTRPLRSGSPGRGRLRASLRRVAREFRLASYEQEIDIVGAAMEDVREHFQKKASSFDRLYDEDHPLQRLLRPGLNARREFALEVAREHVRPRVLDVGCGSGRVGEEILAAGASEYVGIDFSEPMLELAGQRLAHFGERARLVQGNFLEHEFDRPFDVVIVLGVFDYTPEPHEFVLRARRACSGSVVATFPRWNWLKGPARSATRS